VETPAAASVRRTEEHHGELNMSDFTPDAEETPVLFRKSEGEVTAVFPCEPATYDGGTMTCYAHVGQHSACSFGWYAGTRAARPEEYASLVRELEGPPYGYRLKIYRRLTRDHRRQFLAELHRGRVAIKTDPRGAPWTAPSNTPDRKSVV
jgi:hypothetical protein